MLNIQDISQSLFKSHPTVKCFYFTSDGQAFELEERAVTRSAALRDNSITEVYHPDMSEAEIREYKDTLEAEAAAGALASFKRANPELSKLIELNAKDTGKKTM